MGKRKSSSKPMGPKKKDPLPTTFTCLFCNHEQSVIVKLDKKAGVGQLDCRVCGQNFQCAVNYLSAAVDVYGEWVDAADSVAKEHTQEPASYSGTSRKSTGKESTRGDGGDSQNEGEGYEGDGVVPDEDDDDDY